MQEIPGDSKQDQLDTRPPPGPAQRVRRNEGPDQLREQYKIAVDWVRHHDERRWTLIGAFVVVNGLLLATAFLSPDVASISTKRVAASLGIVNAVFWAFITWRNDLYLTFVVGLAKDLECAVLGEDSSFRIWADPARLHQGVAGWTMARIRSGVIVFAMIGLVFVLWTMFLAKLVT